MQARNLKLFEPQHPGSNQQEAGLPRKPQDFAIPHTKNQHDLVYQ